MKISSSGALVEDKTVTISLSSTSETLEINCVVTSFWFDSLEVAIEDKVVWNSADDWDAGDWVVGGWDVGGKYLVVSNSLLTWSWNSFVDEIGKEVVILSSDVSWETFWTDDKVVWWVWFFSMSVSTGNKVVKTSFIVIESFEEKPVDVM